MLGLVGTAAMLWMATQAPARWYDAGAASEQALVPVYAPALPDDGGPFPAGSPRQAQHQARLVAEAFADCVHRARGQLGLEAGAPPPYGRCVKARSFGLTPSDVGRRGRHGPIAGRGARNQLGVFTGHRGAAAYLLQYDAAGRGWGFAFAATGRVAPVCRTIKGRVCWDAEYERPGALFLGDAGTASVLEAVLELGRAPG